MRADMSKWRQNAVVSAAGPVRVEDGCDVMADCDPSDECAVAAAEIVARFGWRKVVAAIRHGADACRDVEEHVDALADLEMVVRHLGRAIEVGK